ncbi:nitroreductase family protein [Bacillus sp. ISL-35]|uniref:nitroreductase family protein n=1 Tax=Bacillus sp. ISL-35 TaxID=2819122 RepID=UPI001BE50F79|nr:nitroreductase family protein [Bacillus sp. ISL-35]MBT2679679.1 nitroreductase family protein [Bacillus sp. ISL-35]MBT2704712.1 nitroreductase family protein [Chryseobacterium sp. ISL-80]
MNSTETGLATVIRERRSVRKYDTNFKISREEILDILKEATLAPSSSNLQPWKFIVIQDEAVKKELRAIANNQEQVETASAVIAVLGDREMYRNSEKVYRSSFEAGYMDETTMGRMIENSNKLYPSVPVDMRENIASFDAGLVTMQLMLIAKARGYDTVPMGGFNRQQFIEKFNIEDRYMPSLLIALGKAAAPGHKTTRLPIEEVVEFI